MLINKEDLQEGDVLVDCDGDAAVVKLTPKGLHAEYISRRFGVMDIFALGSTDKVSTWWVEHRPLGQHAHLVVEDDEGDSVIVGPALPFEPLAPSSAAKRGYEILKSRDGKYGNINQEVAVETAKLWGSYLGIELDATKANVLMVLHKIARQKVDPEDNDHYDDGIGYMSMAAYAKERNL